MYPKAILQSAVSCLIYTMTKKGKDFCFNCHSMMLRLLLQLSFNDAEGKDYCFNYHLLMLK